MLLDSHVVLWLVAAPQRLASPTVRLIQDAAAVHVSSVTHAELTIKAMLGRLRIPDDLPDRLAAQGLAGLPFTGAHARELRRFPDLTHHDPFDRMLLAQAASEAMPFLTADRRLVALGLSWIVEAVTSPG